MPSIPLTAEDSDQVVPTASRKVFVAVDEDGNRIGETHQNSKLTDHDVDLIRELAEGGMPQQLIAEKFEVSKSTISMICSYQRRATTIARWKAMLLHFPVTLTTKGSP